MNKYENAIAEIQDRAEHTLKTVLSADTVQTTVEALQEKQAGTLLKNACEFIGQEFNHSYDYVLSCLKAQAERDKMRCENCKYFFCESAVDRYSHCNNFHGLKNIDVVENKTFCSYFEPKENEHG